MKVVYNKLLPFRGFYAITIFYWIFIRDYNKWKENTSQYRIMLNHEGIHWEQCKETGLIFFYILYVLEWLIKLIISIFTGDNAYRSISFEQEAFNFESTAEYKTHRKHYRWINYIFKMTK